MATVRRLVIFTIGSEVYGVDIEAAREVIVVEGVTPLPGTPDYVKGVISLRGRVVPVLDLQLRLGLPQDTPEGVAEVVISDVEDQLVGFAVGHVREVRTVEARDIHRELELPGQVAPWVEGVAEIKDEMVTLLNLRTLIKDEAVLGI